MKRGRPEASLRREVRPFRGSAPASAAASDGLKPEDPGLCARQQARLPGDREADGLEQSTRKSPSGSRLIPLRLWQPNHPGTTVSE